MNKSLFSLGLLITLFINCVQAQITVPLSELNVKNNKTEYKIDEMISGTDYTYLSKDYSPQFTRFYKGKELFTGVATIRNAGQQTEIHFKNGQLHGLWYDIMLDNNNLVHKGNYKKGLKHGKWMEGHQDKQSNTINSYKREKYKKGLLHGLQKNYASYYSNRTFIANGYEGIKYNAGKQISIPNYYNAKGKLKNGIEQKMSETNIFKKGIILKQEIRIGATLIQSNNYTTNNLTYDIIETKYHKNGKLKSQGQLKDFYKKAGEWLYYNENGTMVKKEIWNYLPELDFPRKKKTIYYKKDGTIEKEMNY